MTDPSTSCYFRGCSAPSASTGTHLPQPLCERHLAQDTAEVQRLKDEALKELQPLKALLDELRADQRGLAAELQTTQDLFESAVESLINWKEAVLSRLAARHEASLQKLRELSVLQEYEIALAEEAEAGADLKKVFSLSAAIRAECRDFKDKRDGLASAGREIGDVSGGVRDLQLLIDRQLSDVMQLCESGGPVCEEKSICELHSEIGDLPGRPMLITSCSNTKGFFADGSGRVVKSESGADGAQRLPEPCVFVAFDEFSKMDHLQACSIDGSVRLQVRADLDWSKSITGLSCDSKRQALYISQADWVKVADLSGRVSREINSSSLRRPVRFTGLACSSDKIISLNQSGPETQLLCIDKDSGQLQSSVSVGSVPLNWPEKHMSVIDHTVLISDWDAGKLYKVCITSGQLISTYPTRRSLFDQLQQPSGVAAHRSGLLFVSESGREVVRVMRSDGTVLQTVGVEGRAGSGQGEMDGPLGLAFVEGNPKLLAVCQYDRRSISLFQLQTVSVSLTG